MRLNFFDQYQKIIFFNKINFTNCLGDQFLLWY